MLGDLFSKNDFQYGLRSSCFIADTLSYVSDSIIRVCNMPGPAQTVAHDISKAFDIWCTIPIHRRDSFGIFSLVLSGDDVLLLPFIVTTLPSTLDYRLSFDEKSYYKMVRLFEHLNWIWVLKLCLLQKMPQRKLELLFIL